MAPQEQTSKQEQDEPAPRTPNTVQPYKGEIAICGISGRYPDSGNVGELAHNLFNKINMITVDNRRWEPGFMGTPEVMGKVKTLTDFDAEFFGIHAKSGNTMDPMLRIMLEVAYEAIVDAGESLESMKGTKTGVYIGVSVTECEVAWMKNWTEADCYMVQGCPHSMFANWISFFFDLRGPSTAYNTACSTSLVAMEAAERHLRMGSIDNAIVGACNFMYRPVTSRLFSSMNFLSDSACKAFDISGNGFVRGEVASAILLKKADTAKRMYATLVGSLLNNDGFQLNGILYPNTLAQEQLMRDVYTWLNVNPNEVKYFECHGTGTPAGDPNETKAICNAICRYRKDPLLIGSVKSNLGHGETASGIAGISKCMIIMHSRAIPPNLHFNTPNPNIPGLFDGRLKVVTETTPFDGGLIAINSFGMGGTNAHCIFKSFDKKAEPHPASDKPRLFTYCARTEDGLRHILEEAHKNASNVEFHALCQESANTKPKSMPYRGATILNGDTEFTEIQKCSSKPREVWFIYSGMGSQWLGMGRSLMALDVFRESIEETAAILKPLGVDLMGYLTHGTEETLKEIMPPFICINSVQLALTDLLTSMGIVPDGLVGHSLGEVGCAYADGCLTRREAVMSAYWRAKVVLDGEVAPGKMAAVELTWEEAKRLCPPGVVAACHNSQDSVTISGGAQEMAKFMAELTAQGIMVKEVNSSNISYHSPHMKKLSVDLKNGLEKEIVPKPRTKRWVSTSIPEERWDEPLAETAGASYHANNLLSPVLFYEGLQKVPPNAIVIEIAPSGLLQSVIKKSLGPECISVALQKRKHQNNLEIFFSALGKCYSHGVKMNPLGLYPAVQFPVSIQTPMLSNMISEAWDHSAKWRIPELEEYEFGGGSSSDHVFDIDLSDDSPDQYLMDHEVDGRMLFPATGTLVLAWKTLAKIKGVEFDQLAVQLSNIQIHQALFLIPSGKVSVSVSVMPITGEFQVRSNDTLLSSGVITSSDGPILETDQHTKKGSVLDGKSVTEIVTTNEIYRELLLRGYEYGPYFRGITRASLDARYTDITWDGRWISYLDTVLQMCLLSRPGTHQSLPVLLESVIIDPRVHPRPPPEGATEFESQWDPNLDIVAAGGVEIRGSHTIRSARKLTHALPNVEEYTFAPYMDPSPNELSAPAVSQALRDYADACFEYSRQGMKKWLAEDKNNLLPNKQEIIEALDLANKVASTPETASNYSSAKATLEALVNSKNGHSLPNYGVFEMLDMTFSEPLEGDYWETLRKKLHEVRAYLWDDPVIAAMESPNIIKLVIETVADNVNQQVVDVLECGAARGAYYRQAIPKALEYLSVKDYRYSIADKFFVEDAVDYPVKILQFDPLDPVNFPAAQNESYDLLILKWTLHMQVDLDAAITGFSKMLKPGGFILVEENVLRLSTFFPIKAIVSASLGGRGGPEGDRSLGCFYTDAQWSALFARHGLEQIMHRHDGISASLFLLRKPLVPTTPPVIINVDDQTGSWLEEVQARCAELRDSPQDARLWLVAKTELSGILGFFRSLTWEFGSDKVRCVHIADNKPGVKLPQITVDSPDFKEIQRKDMVYNVFKNGKWGTYRGFIIPEAARQLERPSECVFADLLTAGDVSSLRWFDSPLKTGHHNGNLGSNLTQQLETETCSVYYAGLNLRDVMLANGTLQRDVLPEETFFKEGVLGIEFSGRNSSGKRVMGLCSPPALASSIQCPLASLWTVPDYWTLEEAATVPLAYTTAYYCLVTVGGIQKGKTVFIHAGTSPVGQAAIAISLSHGCKVFTLTSNRDETALLKSIYPQLKDTNFCNSEDCSFETHIRTETKGKGVDIALGCLRGKPQKASRRLLARQGVFVDIGFKVDDHTQIAFYTREQTDFRFQLDALLENQGPEWTRLYDLVQTGIQNGVVKPLRRAIYDMDRLVDAFKTVEAQRETAKVLIKIRDEEKTKLCQAPKKTFSAVHRTCFDPSKSHIVVGGMGGMGLETAHWMVLRGAKKILLTSRTGITTGYQARKISFLKKLGAEVEVLAISVNSRETANKLFDRALKMGPVGGILNIATALSDGEFHLMTREQFLKPLESKITTTMLLDEISREKPVRDTLDHFVMYSSIVVSHGHMGQSNYAFGNTVLEKICERRKRDGLPATVPQWASIADVGIVALMGNKTIITRKYPQRFFSVLNVMDYMMSYEGVVTTSYVLIEKSMLFTGGEESMVEQVLHAVGKILGVKNVSTVDGDKQFVDLGVDSLMSVEIKQALERDIDLVLSTKDIQVMTFNALRAIVEGS